MILYSSPPAVILKRVKASVDNSLVVPPDPSPESRGTIIAIDGKEDLVQLLTNRLPIELGQCYHTKIFEQPMVSDDDHTEYCSHATEQWRNTSNNLVHFVKKDGFKIAPGLPQSFAPIPVAVVCRYQVYAADPTYELPEDQKDALSQISQIWRSYVKPDILIFIGDYGAPEHEMFIYNEGKQKVLVCSTTVLGTFKWPSDVDQLCHELRSLLKERYMICPGPRLSGLRQEEGTERSCRLYM